MKGRSNLPAPYPGQNELAPPQSPLGRMSACFGGLIAGQPARHSQSPARVHHIPADIESIGGTERNLGAVVGKLAPDADNRCGGNQIQQRGPRDVATGYFLVRPRAGLR